MKFIKHSCIKTIQDEINEDYYYDVAFRSYAE